jgi:hypothetical protein
VVRTAGSTFPTQGGRVSGQVDVPLVASESPHPRVIVSASRGGLLGGFGPRQVVAQDGLDQAADAVVGQAAVEVLDELGGSELADLAAVFDGGVPEGDQWLLPVPAGPIRVMFSRAPIHSREHR